MCCALPTSIDLIQFKHSDFLYHLNVEWYLAKRKHGNGNDIFCEGQKNVPGGWVCEGIIPNKLGIGKMDCFVNNVVDTRHKCNQASPQT